MDLLHRKKNGIYANISLFLSYSKVTVATRSSLYPDQMVDQHLAMTPTALNVSRDQDTLMSPRDRSPMKTLSPRCHRDKTSGTRWVLCSKCWFVWPEGNCPPTEPGFSQSFFSILSPMEFWFLAAVTSGLLSWGHFISSNIVDLIEQILLELNWPGGWHHWIQWWAAFNWKFTIVILHYRHTIFLFATVKLLRPSVLLKAL